MSQVWLITGSSRGFGRALAEAVLAAGHRLVATARNPRQLDGLAERYGDRVRLAELDVTNFAQAEAAVATATEAFGRLDVLVNNAGYGSMAPVEDTTMEAFRTQLETNLFGVIGVTKAALPVMHAQRSGHIIQFSSIGGRNTAPGLGPYQTAKFAVEGFSGVLAKEVGPLGIRVTVIEPGGFRTDWAGPSMTIAETDPDYDATVGALARHLIENAGHEPGDPAKAARVILEVAAMDEPPLQLVLGREAIDYVDRLDRARLEENARWRHLSVATDFDDAESSMPTSIVG